MTNQQGAAPRRARCPRCNGSGQQANPVKCSYCDGTGRRLRVSEGGFEGGYRRSESHVQCIYCDGTGQAMSAPSHVPCTLCRGTGEGLDVPALVPCPACHGSRQTTVPDGSYMSGKPRLKAVPCVNCGARGVINGWVFQAAR